MTSNLPIVFEMLLSVGVIVGCIVAYFLLVVSKGNILLNRLLVSQTAFIFLCFIFISKSQGPSMQDLTFLPKTFFPFHYVLSPLFYLYFRTFIQDDARLSKKDLFHCLPICIHLMYISPLIVEILQGEVTWAHLLASGRSPDKQFAYGPIPNHVHTLIRISVSTFYFSLIWIKYKSNSFSEFMNRNKELYPYSIRWIKYFIWTTTLILLSSIILKIEFLMPGINPTVNHQNILTWLITIGCLGLLSYLMLNPVILLGLPHFLPSGYENSIKKMNESPPTQQRYKIIGPNNTPSVVTENKLPDTPYTAFLRLRIPATFEKTHISPDSEHHKILQLIDRIDCYVEQQQPFTSQSWNMDMLSKELSVPKHHLLYLFSQILQQSFVDYRNELRVKHVQESLRNRMYESKTLESIGLESGFPSRATFFSVFKKITGITPGQFVENLTGETPNIENHFTSPEWL